MSEHRLQPFCSTASWRPYLQGPFSRGEFTYATDGHVLVRIPRDADVPEVEKSPAAEKIFEQNPAENFVHAPIGPIAKQTWMDCETCDARGYEHECPDCACKCEDCGGEGRESADRHHSIGVMGIPLGLRLVRLIWTLPGLELAFPPPKDFGAPWAFRFDGGEGVVMTRREKAPEHLEWAAQEDAIQNGGPAT